jgi:hypothetical protein
VTPEQASGLMLIHGRVEPFHRGWLRGSQPMISRTGGTIAVSYNKAGLQRVYRATARVTIVYVCQTGPCGIPD